MKIETELALIKEIITEYSAIEYADAMIEKEKSKGQNTMVTFNSKTGSYGTVKLAYDDNEIIIK